MISPEDISRAKRLLEQGVTPENVARELGIGRSSLVDQLKDSGYRIRTWRTLEPIIPIPISDPSEDKEALAA
jgi:DNA invertase Pin-like site-specific DNA recombinase